jgi:crossover junction endodeoxyribonuclease RusA
VRVTSYRDAETNPGSAAFGGPSAAKSAILKQAAFPKRPSLGARPVRPSATVTMDTLTITLPVPPSINHQYATVNGRRLLSSVGRAYKASVSEQVWLALAQSPYRQDLLRRLQSSPLSLSIRFFFTSTLRRDVDGGLKIAQDALCEGLAVNDNRIVETHLFKNLDKLHPRIEVRLSTALTPDLVR